MRSAGIRIWRNTVPHSQLTANTENWGGYYIDEVRKELAGTWTGVRHTNGGIKEGMVVLTPLNASIPPDLAALVAQRKAAIAAGQLHPFSRTAERQYRRRASCRWSHSDRSAADVD